MRILQRLALNLPRDCPSVSNFLFVVLLEIRASQNLTELGGGVRKMSGMRGQERNRVNCVTGERRLQKLL